MTYQGTEEQFPLQGSWISDQNMRDNGRCPEVAAAVLVHCWNLPEYRPLFDLPDWELKLHDVVAGSLSEEEEFFESPWRSIRQRLPWLGLNLLTTTLIASVITFFEDTIQTLRCSGFYDDCCCSRWQCRRPDSDVYCENFSPR